MEKKFETAIRMKLRFKTNKGEVTVEDLFDMPLLSTSAAFCLDDVARDLYKELKDGTDLSFVRKQTNKMETVQLKFDIVKYVIDIKIKEKEERENEAAMKAQKERITRILADKKDSELMSKSITELEAMLS